MLGNNYNKIFKTLKLLTIITLSVSVQFVFFIFFVSATEISDSINTSLNEYSHYLDKGIEHLNSGNFVLAKEYLSVAQQFAPQNPDPLINLAVANIFQEKFDEALRLLNTANTLISESYPNKHILLYNIGLCYYHKNQYKKAQDWFREALDLNPQFSEAAASIQRINSIIGYETEKTQKHEQKNTVIDQAQHSKTIEETLLGFEEENTADKYRASKLLQSAENSFKNNDNKKAQALINEAISLNPNDPRAYYRLGCVYLKGDDLDNAAAAFQAAIKKDPGYAKAHTNLGGIYARKKNYKEGLKYLNKAALLEPNNPKTYYNIAMIHLALGKEKEALNNLETAKRLCHQTNDSQLLAAINRISFKK
ncbi:MAG: tetratricopeptide repeat protein [Candidatus Omnitrophica bacterium]|nr:tetratricopeptide repeat protein [Candidatus Omnitrophota bacterium]